MYRTAAVVNNSGRQPAAAACLCGDDERDPCPCCQAQHAGTDRLYREASADVAHEYYAGLAEVVGYDGFIELP